MARLPVRRGLLGVLVSLSGAVACQSPRAPQDGQPPATCDGGSAVADQARIDSLGLRAREAGERGDLAVLHAVSDTLDSLQRLVGPPCRPDSVPSGR